MKGAEMKALREAMGLDEAALARQIGYTGSDTNNSTRIREYERGKKAIPLYIARHVWLMSRHHSSCGHLPKWPRWAQYRVNPQPAGVH